MATNKMKSKKKPATKTMTAKSKQPAKTRKSKVELVRITISIPKPLYNKTKQFSLKNKITIKEIVSAAIQEYLNKPAVLDVESSIKRAV